MATPANTSTELRLAKIRQELINNNYSMGAYQVGETSLYQASIGTYGTINTGNATACLLYTSPSPRDQRGCRKA